MTLFDRYILRQFLISFLFILGLILAICVMVDVVEKIDAFIERKPTFEELVFQYYLNFLAYFGVLLTPICVFLAVIYFTSRMAARIEIIPILTTGTSYYRFLRPYILAALLITASIFVFKSYLLPKSTVTRLEFEYKYRFRRTRSGNSKIHKKIARDTYIYIGYYQNRKNEGSPFALERIEDGQVITKMRAKRISWVDSTETWTLHDVFIREIDSVQERIYQVPKIDTAFLLTPENIFVKEQYAETMTLPELLDNIELEEMRMSDYLYDLYIERHRRFSDPIATIILTLIGVAMSSRKARGGVAVRLVVGLLLCFAYISLLFGGQIIVGDGFPAWLAVWMPSIVFFPFALLLVWRAPK